MARRKAAATKAKASPDLAALASAARELAEAFWRGEKASTRGLWKAIEAHPTLEPATPGARELVSDLARFAGEPDFVSHLVAWLPTAWARAFFEIVAHVPEPERPRASPTSYLGARSVHELDAAMAPVRLAAVVDERLERHRLGRGAIASFGAAAKPDAAFGLLVALLAGEEPSPRWGEGARKALAAIDDSAARRVSSEVFELEGRVPGPTVPGLLAERLVWLAVQTAVGPEALRALADRAVESARTGISHPPVAIAIVRALGGLASERAVPELERLRQRVRNRNVLKAVGASLDRLATTAGQSREALEEQAVPDFGLDLDGERRFPEHGLVLALDSSGRAAWHSEKPGKGAVKLAPELKRLGKEIASALAVQRTKLEEDLVETRLWNGARLRKNFLERPLLAHLGRRLVWHVLTGQRRFAFLRRSELVALDGSPVKLAADDVLTLAHPLEMTTDALELARDRLCALGIVQPFKQLFRETYSRTDDEREAGETDRFAGHLVPHGKLYALARTRGWSGFACIAAGSYDGTRMFAHLRARLGTAPATGSRWEDPGRGIRLGALSFEERAKNRRTWARVSLERVPPVLFSEACRDVDLFVGVGSTGEDATWMAVQEAGRHGHTEALRALAHEAAARGSAPNPTIEARSRLLARVLPALGLGDRVRIEGRFARVQGELHAYRVHLGSANVLLEPEGRALVLKPARRAKAPDVYLPEEASADPRLLEVVARILVLAGDRLAGPELRAQLEES